MDDTSKRRGLRVVTAISLGCAAAIALATTPASAITTVPSIYDSGNAGIVHEVGDKRHGYRVRSGYGDGHHHHHHHYGYGPRPYYGYGYWPGYYPPYYGYGYADPYWSRPGVSIGFSFSN